MKNKSYILYFIFAFSFIFLEQVNIGFQGLFIIKAIPVFTLMLLTFIKLTKPINYLLALGFFFSVLGDVTLHIDRVHLFLFGLIFFLIAHIFYIIVFIKKFSVKNKKIFPMIILSAYAGVLAYSFRSIDAKFIIPVYLYLSIITVMVLSSLFLSKKYIFAIAGAVLFMLSDSIIAVDKFIIQIPFSHLAIMFLYYLAQFFIAFAFLKNEQKFKNEKI